MEVVLSHLLVEFSFRYRNFEAATLYPKEFVILMLSLAVSFIRYVLLIVLLLEPAVISPVSSVMPVVDVNPLASKANSRLAANTFVAKPTRMDRTKRIDNPLSKKWRFFIL